MKKIFILLCLFFVNTLCVSAASNRFKVTLSKCVDGDTAKFVVNGEVKTVRFLSINTPEIAHDDQEAEPYGNEASKFTCDALTTAKSIKLQYDPKSDEVDKYGRLLAWIFVDNELLQEKLVKDGLAEVKYVYDDYLYTSNLQALEIAAQENKVGMWSDSFVINCDDNYDDILFNIIVSICSLIFIAIVSIFCKIKKKFKLLKP